MNEIKKPNFKSEDFAGKWKELVRYLYATVDELNWNLLALQNKQTWQGKKIETASADAENSSVAATDDVIFRAKLKRSGTVIHAIVTGEAKSEAVKLSGSVSLVLPKGFSATFYTSAVPIAKTEKMTATLANNIITIDYEFGDTSETLGAYFQYISA